MSEEYVPILEDRAWEERVAAVVDEAHAENLGGEHRDGFCRACACAYLVAQRAVPRTQLSDSRTEDGENVTARALEWWGCSHGHRFALIPGVCLQWRVFQCPGCGTVTLKRADPPRSSFGPRTEDENR